MAPSREAVRLARKLRGLRVSYEAGLTLQALAQAFSDKTPVAVAKIGSWESLTNPTLPSEKQLRCYALFFRTDRSGAGTRHLVSEQELTQPEWESYDSLHQELIGLREAVRSLGSAGSSTAGSSFWDFESGPVTIICPEIPMVDHPRIADERDPNYTRMNRYADLDALFDLWGHLRASNPRLLVRPRLYWQIDKDDLGGHVVVLGGIAWNPLMRRLLDSLEVPVTQYAVPDVKSGEIFKLKKPGGKEFRPKWEETDDGRELVEDVALLIRLRNPFNHSRTITICNGIHSRGVVGAVQTFIDSNVREQNEKYLSNQFPKGRFALLLKVPVVNGEAITPDLKIPDSRLYQWSPGNKGTEW